MIARHVEITGSGVVGASTVGTRVYVVGVSNIGFTNIKLHDSTDSSGPVVANITTSGVTAWNYELDFVNGCYAEVTGSGSASIWVA